MKPTELDNLIVVAIETENIDNLFSYGFMNNIDMYEIWSDDNNTLIGFAVNDDVYYFKGVNK